MTKRARSRKFSARQSARLGSYLAAGLGAAATSTTDAAIVNINIGPTGFDIGQINGGLTAGGSRYVPAFPEYGSGSALYLLNGGGANYIGLYQAGYGFVFAGLGTLASPTNFALNDVIGAGATWQAYGVNILFRRDTYQSADFGPGSYMGFRTPSNKYGWLEVTWTSSTQQFQILSGAYESDPGVAILAGNTGGGPAAVPEPGTWAAAALLAGGAAFARWRKRRDEAQKEAA